MLKLLLWSAAILAAGIAGLLVYAATLPDRFGISRTANIKAPPEKIFPLIQDLQAFNTWNPFLKMDPQSKLAYTDIKRGKGASYTFDGGKAGTGSIEIAGVKPASEVEMILHMKKPLEAHNRLVFSLQRKGETTDVTWSMSGEHPLIGRMLSVIMSMDKMVGVPFENGLADLKSLVEK